MGRLPFNPDRMTGPGSSPPGRSSAPAEPDGAIRVSQLAAKIDAALKSGLPASVLVRGEVSGARNRTHWYFDLKDEAAVVSCVLFAGKARSSPCQPENGMEVVAKGRVEFYAPGGKTSFIVDRLEPVGRGELEVRLRALLDELRTLGWMDPDRKKRLPAFPSRVAVVTSRTGAALQDVLDTARRRAPWVEWLVLDARVQGERAAPEIAAAIRGLSQNRVRLGLDALLVTRGGGSLEDLWAFNEREVAEAIMECDLPIVAAIGHETDTTIAELVADERCATPTQAAVRLTPDREAIDRQLASDAGRLTQAVKRTLAYEQERVRSAARAIGDPGAAVRTARASTNEAAAGLREALRGALSDARRELDAAAERLERVRPAEARERALARLARAESRLAIAFERRVLTEDDRAEQLAGRLGRVLRRRGERAKGRLDRARGYLDAVGPGAVLSRGYTWTETADGKLVRSASEVEPGAKLVTRLSDGRVRSTVDGAKPAKAIRRRKKADDEGPGLFGSAPG